MEIVDYGTASKLTLVASKNFTNHVGLTSFITKLSKAYATGLIHRYHDSQGFMYGTGMM
jgi:hypothetical protein